MPQDNVNVPNDPYLDQRERHKQTEQEYVTYPDYEFYEEGPDYEFYKEGPKGQNSWHQVVRWESPRGEYLTKCTRVPT
jgi:hypothetical protein